MAKFYQVGGSVRDELMGLKSKDIDYAVEASSFDEMRAAILARGGEIFLETPQYLTIRARVPDLGACDFVLCRKDGAYSDGRHPDSVEVGTILDDLARRDFTVNAIAKTEQGEYEDPYDGISDIEDRVLQCVGKAEDRFTEDGLRMIRAIRFQVTKNFDTQGMDHLLKDYTFFAPRLAGVSNERIREELAKMFEANTPLALDLLNYYDGLRNYIFRDKLWLKPTLEER